MRDFPLVHLKVLLYAQSFVQALNKQDFVVTDLIVIDIETKDSFGMNSKDFAEDNGQQENTTRQESWKESEHPDFNAISV